MKKSHDTYWKVIWRQFCHHPLGVFSLWVIIAFALIGIYAPFLASSKPLSVYYNHEWYFPLFRYLFYSGYYTKNLDLFFNIFIFILPLLLCAIFFLKNNFKVCVAVVVTLLVCHVILFGYLIWKPVDDPASNPQLNREYQQVIQKQLNTPEGIIPNWSLELQYMTSYAKLNLLLRQQQLKEQHEKLSSYKALYSQAIEHNWLLTAIQEKKAELIQQGIPLESIPKDETLINIVKKQISPEELSIKFALPTLWQMERNHEDQKIQQETKKLSSLQPGTVEFIRTKAKIQYIQDKHRWLKEQSSNLKYEIMPLIRPFHWEDDAAGEQNLNQYIPWWELTRINRKDLVAALIFGVRISLVVGITAVGLSLLIGLPVGALAGFYGGTIDILVSRLLEIWEAMPTFFMLLMFVAITQSKSVFLIIIVIGVFGWTSFSRYIRGEFFKQRNLPYIEACRAMGFKDSYIMFFHILPNAIPPLLTLLPFAIMAAITSEAGLSFLGLGEEGSSSWGVLMDEGRTAFPSESYLLWPPAILLTILLIAIALCGDALRDALDPKMHRIEF